MRVVLYARVSTQRQAEKQLSIPAQLRALSAYASEKEWEIVDEYVDEARSGRTSRRPAFTRMLSELEWRDVDAIFVWKLDRLARNMEISTALAAYCRKFGVKIISLHEPVDETPQGILMGHIFEGIAEFYSNNLSQDIQRGKREAARRGYYPHGRPPIGYRLTAIDGDKVERHRLEPDPIYAPVIERIFNNYAHGSTGPQIMKSLNAEGIRTGSGRRWTTRRIYDILRNPIYCGDIVVGRQYVDAANKVHPGKNPVFVRDAHPGIISRDLFDRVQDLLESRSTSHQRRNWDTSPYLLSGLVRCGLCGRHMVVKSAKSGRYHYYTCQKYMKEGKDACAGIRVSSKKLESFVLVRVRDVILDEEHLGSLIRMVNEELGALTDHTMGERESIAKQIAEMKRRLARHYEALETESFEMGDLAPRIREIREAIKDLARRGAELSTKAAEATRKRVDRRVVETYVEELRKTLAQGEMQERKAVLNGIIESVTVDQENVAIRYRLPHPNEETESGVPSVLPAVSLSGAWGTRTCCGSLAR